MGLMNTCTHSDCGIRHTSKPYRIPALESEMDTSPYPLPRSYLQMTTTHKGKICFLVQQSYWICKEHLRTDTKTKRILFLKFCFVLSHNDLFGCFLPLLNFCLYIMVSVFLLFLVCKNVCLWVFICFLYFYFGFFLRLVSSYFVCFLFYLILLLLILLHFLLFFSLLI